MAIKFQYNKTSLGELGKQLKIRTRALPTLKNKEAALRRIPELKDVIYDVREFNLFQKPLWYSDGVQILKDLARLGIESEICSEKSRILDFSRKKTTQKVNLYEKVQIPGYNEAILKIKRYLEDEENLSKASQKIVKNRHDMEAEEEAL